MREFEVAGVFAGSVAEVRDVVLLDRALKTEYHVARGDTEVHVTEWTRSGRAFERTVTFRTDLGAPALVKRALGVDHAHVVEVQTYDDTASQHDDPETFVLRARTTFERIPMASNYVSSCAWTLRRDASNASATRLDIVVQVEFTRSIFGITSKVEQMMHDKGKASFEFFVQHGLGAFERFRQARAAALLAPAAPAVSSGGTPAGRQQQQAAAAPEDDTGASREDDGDDGDGAESESAFEDARPQPTMAAPVVPANAVPALHDIRLRAVAGQLLSEANASIRSTHELSARLAEACRQLSASVHGAVARSVALLEQTRAVTRAHARGALVRAGTADELGSVLAPAQPPPPEPWLVRALSRTQTALAAHPVVRIGLFITFLLAWPRAFFTLQRVVVAVLRALLR